MSLYAVDVSLNDPSAPTITGGPSGPAVDLPRYTQGRQERRAWGGSDNTGISEAAWFVDGQQQTRDSGACDYSQPVPCPDMAADTPHPVDLARSARASTSSRRSSRTPPATPTTAGPKTITIDRTAPGPPGALTVVGGDAPATNSFDGRWTNPDGQVAPIARAHYRICPRVRRGPVPAEATASGDNIASLTGLQRPRPGRLDA